MDDIITRWASDLSKYQKEFQSQAETVAAWDRMLVENSEKISKLYHKTFQAERDAAEVEKQLSLVEGNQAELEAWLDKYEREIDEMMARQSGGIGVDGMQGPDQERERTYKAAEKLGERLNELNQDLGEMIEEVNAVTGNLSRGKADDPVSHIVLHPLSDHANASVQLSQVVRVLNSHLLQLQKIDEGAQNLQRQVQAAQHDSRRTGGVTNGAHGGYGSHPADDFYRSFQSRR